MLQDLNETNEVWIIISWLIFTILSGSDKEILLISLIGKIRVEDEPGSTWLRLWYPNLRNFVKGDIVHTIIPVVCIAVFLILTKLTCFLLVMCVSSLLQLPCPAQRFTCSFNYNVPVPANFCFASVFTLVPSRFSNICRYSSSILLLETWLFKTNIRYLRSHF